MHLHVCATVQSQKEELIEVPLPQSRMTTCVCVCVRLHVCATRARRIK